MGVTQRQTQQLQPRRLREWVPGSSLLQTSNFSFLQLPQLQDQPTCQDGRVVFQDIAKPTTMDWGSPLEAMEAALELEKTVNQSLLDIHKVAGDKGDGHLCDFLESEYLSEQVEGIKAVGDLITKMKRAGDGLGLHIIDKEMGS